MDSWLTRNIRPLVVLVSLVAYFLGCMGVPYLLRGTNLTDLELQIIWSVFSLYIFSRGGEKAIEKFKRPQGPS